MTTRLRGKLSLVKTREGLVDESEDGPLQLATLDLALPCRNFVVEHKIADVGKVSVTAEFLLRFIRCMGSCAEEAAQSFFGYNRREMAYVLNEVEDADYVQRLDGRISLTATGSSLFRPGVEEPLIYEVERKTARVGFDLISLAPADKKFLSYFELGLPELLLSNPEQASRATELVPASFRRFFREFAPRIDPDATARRSLYSIDSVSAEDRFSTLVRVRLISTGLKPSLAEVDLSEWRTEYELSDREAVARVVGETIEKLSIVRRADNAEAHDLLVRIAPEYLKEWTRKDGLNLARFYRHAFTSQGDIRADRQTTPIVGSLFTLDNTRRLLGVANYGLRNKRRGAASLYWLIPQVPFWGSTVILPEALEQLRERIGRTNEVGLARSVETVSLTVGRPERWIKEAFGLNHFSDGSVFPSGFEMLLVPGSFVAATVHAPIGQPSGLPVPLGFASFDKRVVSRATQLLEENVGPYKLPEHLVRELDRMAIVPENDEASPA